MYMYKRRQFVYYKKTADAIRDRKSKLNIKKELYVFISKKDEEKCKEPMKIYKNILENVNFEKNKKELLERNEKSHSKCKITFSKRANAEFAFLIQNVEFSEKTLTAAARNMKMGLHEFMAYYNRKKKCAMEAKSEKKEQVVHSRHKHINEKIKFSKIAAAPNQGYSYPEVLPREKKVMHTYKELRVCLTKIDMEVSHVHTRTPQITAKSKKEKIESSEIAAIPSKNEFCGKKEDDLQKNFVTATKRKIDDSFFEKTRKIHRNLQSMPHMHITEKNKKRERDNTHPPDAPPSEEHTLLHPGLLCYDQREKHLNSVDNIHSIHEKIESTEIATTPLPPSENLSKKDERDDLHLYIYPELFVGKIKEDHTTHYACAEQVAREVIEHVNTKQKAKEECVANTVCDVEIKEGEIERTMEIPQSLQEGLYFYMHSIEKNKSVRDNLHPPLQSFDQIRKVSNSVEVIEFFKEKIESSEIGRGVNEEIVPENIKKKEDLPSHVCAHPTKEISESDTVNRLPFSHMYGTEENNKKIHTYPTHDSPKSDEEITVLSFDEPGEKWLSSVEDIEHVFESTEIAGETYLKEKKEGEVNSVVREREFQRTHTPPLHMCPAEDTHAVGLQCENVPVPDDDLGFLLPEDYVHDTVSYGGETCEIWRSRESGGYFSPPQKQYEDISSDSVPSLPFDHTYDAGDNYAPSCSVQDKAPVLQNIADFFVLCAPPSSNIVESSLSASFTSLCDFTIHPPFNKADKTNDVRLKEKLTVPLPSLNEDSDKAVVFNKNDCKEKISETFVCARKKNIWAPNKIMVESSAPFTSDFAIQPTFNNEVDKTNSICHKQNTTTVSSPSVYEEDSDEVIFLDEIKSEKNVSKTSLSEYSSIQNYQYSNNSKQINQPPSNSVPEYDAASFVCARKTNIWAPNFSIVESSTIHPTLNNKVDKTISIFHKQNVTTSVPSVYEKNIEVIVLDDDDDLEQNTLEASLSEYPSKQNYQFSNNAKQLGQPPRIVWASSNKKNIKSSALSVCDFTIHPPFNRKVDKTSGVWHKEKFTLSLPSLNENNDEEIAFNENELEDDILAPNKSIESSAPFTSDFAIHPTSNKQKGATVSSPSVYEEDSDEVIILDDENESEKNVTETSLSEYSSIQNYQYSNNSKQINQPPNNSVPEYDAASFYDMMSNEVLEDKI